jgi:FMN phosphatase YigB (HAD superfamily)
MKVITIDLDHTLYEKDTIINRERVNELFEDKHNFIVIYTSRSWSQFFAIKDLLDLYKVKYHAIVCEKLRASEMIDDKNVGGLKWK